MAGSQWAKRQDRLLWLKSAVKTIESTGPKGISLGLGQVKLGFAHFDSGVKLGQGVDMGQNIFIYYVAAIFHQLSAKCKNSSI